MTKRFEWAAVLAVILLAAGLRFGWAGVNSFAFDEARLSLIALDMARNGHIAELGMPSSAGIPNLPAAAWIFALPYRLSTDPLVATWFVGLLSLLAVVGVWWLARAQWGMWAGLTAALFMAAAPYSVFFSRNIWSQNLLPVMGVMWLLTGYGAQSDVRRTRSINIALNVFLAGFAFQVHFAGAALALGTLYLAIRFRWWRQIKPVLIGGGLALIALVPFIVYALRPESHVMADFRTVAGGAAQIDLTAPDELVKLSLGLDWTHLILGDQRAAPDGITIMALVIGLALLLGLFTLGRDSRRHSPDAGSRPEHLGELALVLLVVSPLAFIRHTTPVYTHYLLAALPALALLAGNSTRLFKHRLWAGGVTGIMAIVACIWSAQAVYSLDIAGRLPTPDGLGVPLGASRDVAYGIPGKEPILFFGHGDNPDMDGEPAVFSTLWWGRPNRMVNGEIALILPSEPAYLAATLPAIQAWEEIEAAGLAQDVLTFARRAGELPFVATYYNGSQQPDGFTATDPIAFDDGTQLEAWRVRWVGPRLRVSTIWRITDSPDRTDYHQFHHLRTTETLDSDNMPVMIADVPMSARNWQVGDRLIVMSDFFIDPEAYSGQNLWVDVGHYTLTDMARRLQLDGEGDLVRLGPFDVGELPNQLE